MQSQKGFTLFELVMVIVVLGVVSVVVGKILYQSVQTYIAQRHVTEIDWQGFVALKRFTDDVHQLRSPGSISTMNANQLSFIDVNGSSVGYTTSGGALLRNGMIMATGVGGFVLSYLNANGGSAVTAASVRYIDIALTITQSNITHTFTALVEVRS